MSILYSDKLNLIKHVGFAKLAQSFEYVLAERYEQIAGLIAETVSCGEWALRLNQQLKIAQV